MSSCAYEIKYEISARVYIRRGWGPPRAPQMSGRVRTAYTVLVDASRVPLADSAAERASLKEKPSARERIRYH